MSLSRSCRPVLAALALTALLSACTGTTEGGVVIRLAVLSGSGSAASLSAVDVGTAGTKLTTPVPGAVDLEALPGGSGLAVLYADHLEIRDPNLSKPLTLPNPTGGGFQACYVKLWASVSRDRLAALSDCGGGALQGVAVWRSDGSLAFSAGLSAPSPTTPLQTRLAVQGDTVWAVHPAVGSGSELLRVTRNSDGSSSLSTPVNLATVNDLTFFRNTLYAATATGVKTLANDGTLTALPSNSQLSGNTTTLYSDDRLLGAWLKTYSAPLLIWNGNKTGTPAYFSALRDLTYAPDGTLYTLNDTTLTQFDSAYGLADSGWRGADLATFSDPRAVSWLIPLGP